MFSPGLTYILAEDLKYCEASRHKDSATSIEDGCKVKLRSRSSEILRKYDKCWIENECICIRYVNNQIDFCNK